MTFRFFRLANLRRCLMLLGLLTMLRPSPAAAAPFVYVANFNTNNVAVIDAATPQVVPMETVPMEFCDISTARPIDSPALLSVEQWDGKVDF